MAEFVGFRRGDGFEEFSTEENEGKQIEILRCLGSLLFEFYKFAPGNIKRAIPSASLTS